MSGRDADSGNSEEVEKNSTNDGGDADSGNSVEAEKNCTNDAESKNERSQDEDCGDTFSEIIQKVTSSQSKHVNCRDADSGNSEEAEKNSTNDGLDTEKLEDTTVHNQQKKSKKDAAGVSGQSDAECEDLDTQDKKWIKSKNKNLKQRKSVKNQEIGHLGDGDVHSHVKKKTIKVAADTCRRYTLTAILLSLLAFGTLGLWLQTALSPPVQKELNFLEVFHEEMDKVRASFPSQRHELWRRSRIHLQKHLNLTNPTEPVSLILTSGRGAERTLGCLAQQLAAAFSIAHNSSILALNGTSKSEEDSDQVKLDIDEALKEAFEGGIQAAVIHHFEDLPPGSTLIFYRYCDHENAAFKKVFLAFTVMLQEDFPRNISLGMVEQVVQEFLMERFVSVDRMTTFNQMDKDKLGGLWSRISHLILPVAAEQKIEQYGCQT